MIEWTIEPHATKRHRAFLRLRCPISREGICRIPITRGPAQLNMQWHWDGLLQQPTITPSIQCNVPGCGRHFSLICGKIIVETGQPNPIRR